MGSGDDSMQYWFPANKEKLSSKSYSDHKWQMFKTVPDTLIINTSSTFLQKVIALSRLFEEKAKQMAQLF